MKRAILLLMFFGIGFALQAQAPCNNRLNQVQFLQKYNQIKQQPSTMAKMRFAKQIGTNYCLMANQIKQIAWLLPTDYYRIDFIVTAYPKIADPINYYEVFNAITSYANLFRLYDLLAQIRSKNNYEPYPPMPTTQWPYLPYPDVRLYSGPTRCPAPLSDLAFIQLIKPLRKMYNTQNKLNQAFRLTQTYCFSTEQIMKVATLFSADQMRFAWVKGAWPRVYDPGNYTACKVLFSNAQYFDQLLVLVHGRPNDNNDNRLPNPPAPVCKVSPEDMSSIIKSIENTSFSDTKKQLAKQIISAKKCFTVNQLKQIIQQFSFDSDRLAMAKFAYDYCIDKDNYYRMNDVFSFSSSKEDLAEYIRGRD